MKIIVTSTIKYDTIICDLKQYKQEEDGHTNTRYFKNIVSFLLSYVLNDGRKQDE